jgi:hypothetical protein
VLHWTWPGSRVRRLLTALSVVVTVFVVSSTALASGAGPPFTRYDEPRSGFSVAVPTRWEPYRDGDPGFHQIYGGAFPASVKFAAGERDVHRFTITFRVDVFTGYRGTLRDHARSTLLSYRGDPKAPIPRSGRSLVTSSNFVQLPAGRAWRLETRFPHAANNGVDNVLDLEYAFVRNSRVYVFRYLVIQTLSAKYAEMFDRSARSIRFGR